MRVTRATRLSVAHRLALAAEDVRRRIGERLSIKQTEVESVKPAETVKPSEKITPTVTMEETPGQKLRRHIEQQRQQQQRRSRGVGI
jgi:hypothetical protein